jgi:hypothetical protein
MNKSSESYKVYLDKTEAAKSGVSDQKGPKVDGQSYPGRPTPPVQTVTTAEVKTGTAVRCAKDQTGMNRYPINSHVAEKKEAGPNN